MQCENCKVSLTPGSHARNEFFYRKIKEISFMYHLLFEGLEILIDAGVVSFINSLRAETLGECKEVEVQVGGIEESCISFVL